MTDVTSNPPTGTPSWVDLGIPDLGRARNFYGAVFGWEFDEGPAETGHYTMCLLRGQPVAAIMQNPDPTATSFWWNLYFATDDLDGTVKRVVDAGGQIPMEPMDVMEQGRMAIAFDPAGAQFGLWQGQAHIGARIVNEPGSLSWNELWTADTEAAGSFYRTVFGHTLEPIPGDFDYITLKVNDNWVAGIFGVADAKPFWLTYFAVDDTDAAVGRAVAAGGTVVSEAADSPYGRIAGIRDLDGAELRLIKPAENPPT